MRRSIGEDIIPLHKLKFGEINMLHELKSIIATFERELKDVSSIEALNAFRSGYSGSSSKISAMFKSLSTMSNADKKSVGAELTRARDYINSALNARKAQLLDEQIRLELQKEALDLTLPPRRRDCGSIHPCNFVISETVGIFQSMGFMHIEGPEIEDDFHNFTALNTPKNHPARQMQDTFYVESSDGCDILRTHTSNAQIHAMLGNKPPMCMISSGRVFRRDFDATHTPMFHQIEGLCVRESVSIAELMGCLREFIFSFLNTKEVEFRFRPSYFPFTEPSLELDIMLNGRWLEILGCGMVHPNVLRNVNIEPDQFSGFAFGMGVERLVMIKYGIKDIRELFENDLRWLDAANLSPLRYRFV